jgi:hypothetical protein
MNVEKVWGARYTLDARYLSKNTIVSNNSRMKIKVCFVDKSCPLRVLAHHQRRNVKWYLGIRKRTIKIFIVMPKADSLSSSDLIAYFGKKFNFEV